LTGLVAIGGGLEARGALDAAPGLGLNTSAVPSLLATATHSVSAGQATRVTVSPIGGGH
jgi:hypothetical protein